MASPGWRTGIEFSPARLAREAGQDMETGPKKNTKDKDHGIRRRGPILRRARWWILGVVIVLVGLRLALAPMVESYVNRQLNRAKDYTGQIHHVDIQLWRGQYRIHGVHIFKRTGDVRSPLFDASRVDLSIEWRELFHGSVVGEVDLIEPKLNFVAGPTEQDSQTGKDEDWNTIITSLFPFKLNRFEIKKGQVHFQNEHSKPPVDISMIDMTATATNLSNSRDVKAELPAGVTAHATTIGGGGLDLQLQLNPLANGPTYQLTAALTNVDLVAMNDFLKAYGKFDVERGNFALYTSIASTNGTYEGYCKVFFKNLKVFAWEKEKKKDFLEGFWEAIVGTVATIFKNQSKDTLAARIPISGSEQGTKIGTWTAVSTTLRNAFIRALVPGVDEKVTLKKVENDQGKPKEEDEKKNQIQQSADSGAKKLMQPPPGGSGTNNTWSGTGVENSAGKTDSPTTGGGKPTGTNAVGTTNVVHEPGWPK